MIRCTTVLQWEYAPPPNFEQNRMVYIWLWDCGYGVESWGGQQLYAQIFAHSQTCMWWMLPRAWEWGKWAGCSMHRSLCLYSPHHREPLPLLWFMEGFQVWMYSGTVYSTTFGEKLLLTALYCNKFSMWLKWKLEPLILGGHLLCLLWQHVTCMTFANCVYSDMMKK